jgi:phosphatidylglycerophosphate synthase
VLDAATRPLPLPRWSRVNAVVLLLATAAALGVRDTAPYVAVGALSFVALGVACLGRFTPRGAFGAGNALTALRFAIASAVGLVPDSVPTPALGATVLGVFALDGLDGWVAKRRGESSEFGAHFDMETDAYFVLLIGIELFTRGRYGAWILVVGLLRYVYVLALALVPARRGDKPRFTFGRHAFTGLMLGLSLGMMVGEPLGSVATLVGCGLVTASFLHSFYWSYSAPPPAG